MMRVPSGAILADVALAVRMLAQVIVEVLGERGGVAGYLATLQPIPYCDALVLGVGGRFGGCTSRARFS